MLFSKIFLIGTGLLGGAIALNYIASALSLTTWYTFLQKSKDTSVFSYIWLFIVYPLCLGALAYYLVSWLTS
ncbi:hypothetical protein H0W80_02890 [Candidatus Saccharibacteria bacterium]|nr:hypothetical protein [Candidatus Saccharibacteria bacterium]